MPPATEGGPWPWIAAVFAFGFFSLAGIIATAQYREKRHTNGNGHSRQRWAEVADLIENRLKNLEHERDLWRDRWHSPANPDLGIANTIQKVVYVVKNIEDHEERLRDLERE
jgi:hypothetical protein